jgi:hypothetical protein
MSMHFDVAVAFDLKPTTPQQVLDTICFLVRTQDSSFSSPPEDPFFAMDGWQNVFQAKPEATYCPGDLYKTFRSAYRFTRQNVKHYRHTLSFRCYVLDDEFYHLFYPLLQWLALQSETAGFVGYYRERLEWWPTLIFFKDGEVYFHEAKESPEPMRKEAPPW